MDRLYEETLQTEKGDKMKNHNDYVKEYGNLLSKIRINEKESYVNMAKKLGVSATMIRLIEKGERNIPKHFTKKLITAYDLEQSNMELAQALKTLNEARRHLFLIGDYVYYCHIVKSVEIGDIQITKNTVATIRHGVIIKKSDKGYEIWEANNRVVKETTTVFSTIEEAKAELAILAKEQK